MASWMPWPFATKAAVALAATLLAGCAPTGRTVTGTVVDEREVPIAGARVRIDGRTRTTASDGKFALLEVPPVYDATIALPNQRGFVFDGMERRIPRFRVVTGTEPIASRAKVRVVLPTPLAANDRALVWPQEADPTTIIVGYRATTAPDGSEVELEVDWAPTQTPFSVWVHVLRFSVDGEGLPERYEDAFWKEVPLTASAEATLTLEPWPVETAPLTFVTELESGFVPVSTSVGVRIGGLRMAPPLLGTRAGAEVTLNVPIQEFIRLDVRTVARGPDGAEVETVRRFQPRPEPGARLVLTPPRALSARVAGDLAALDRDAKVALDDALDLSRVTLRPAEDPTLPSFVIVTRESERRLDPRLDDLGLAVLPGVPYLLEIESSSYDLDTATLPWVPAPDEVRVTRAAPRTVRFAR
jgi:hypothetical protein